MQQLQFEQAKLAGRRAEESKEPTGQGFTYKYNPNNPDKPKAGNYQGQADSLINDIRNHWKGQPPAAQAAHWNYLQGFVNNEDKQVAEFFSVKGNMAKTMGSEANLPAEKMGAFLQEQWKFNPGDWAIKYWSGIQAYNTKSTGGIRAEDFLDCWKAWDIKAFDFYHAPAPSSVSAAMSVLDPWMKTTTKSAQWEAFSRKCVDGHKSYWSRQAHPAQKGHKGHLYQCITVHSYYMATSFKHAKTAWDQFAG